MAGIGESMFYAVLSLYNNIRRYSALVSDTTQINAVKYEWQHTLKNP